MIINVGELDKLVQNFEKKQLHVKAENTIDDLKIHLKNNIRELKKPKKVKTWRGYSRNLYGGGWRSGLSFKKNKPQPKPCENKCDPTAPPKTESVKYNPKKPAIVEEMMGDVDYSPSAWYINNFQLDLNKFKVKKIIRKIPFGYPMLFLIKKQDFDKDWYFGVWGVFIKTATEIVLYVVGKNTVSIEMHFKSLTKQSIVSVKKMVRALFEGDLLYLIPQKEVYRNKP